jgi:ABC transport system ATP-binding/permease protein
MVTITGFGTSIANDPCWQKPEDARKKLTDDEKTKTCQCLGAKIFDKCKFPGLKADFDKARFNAKEPVKPKPPEDPFNLDAKKDFDKKIDQYTKDYGKWKGDREGAIKGAENLISLYQKNNGSMFAVNVREHWLAMCGLLACHVRFDGSNACHNLVSSKAQRYTLAIDPQSWDNYLSVRVVC